MNRLNRFTREAIRPLLALVLLATVPAGVEAQVAIGIKAGATFATMSESTLEPNFESQTGWLAGAHLTLGSGTFTLQPEALLAQLGAQFSDGDVLKTNYLLIPVNLRLNFGAAGIQPFLIGGGYAGFNLSCDIEEFECDDSIEGTDWGLDFGGGLKFGGRLGFFVEARYNLGLTEISEDISIDSKNRAFVIMGGISF